MPLSMLHTTTRACVSRMFSTWKRSYSYSIYTGTVDKEWRKGEGGILSEATTADDTWKFLRMKPASLLKTSIEAQEEQPVPSWGGFNSILYLELPSASKTGYCPITEGSSTEFSTVCTVMKHAQKMCTNLRQVNSVITFDLAIYTKIKQIQMNFPEEFSGTVIRFAVLDWKISLLSRGIEWFLRAFGSICEHSSSALIFVSTSSDQFSHASSEHFVNFPPAGISLY